MCITKINLTRMHSSRMRTACLLTVCLLAHTSRWVHPFKPPPHSARAIHPPYLPYPYSKPSIFTPSIFTPCIHPSICNSPFIFTPPYATPPSSSPLHIPPPPNIHLLYLIPSILFTPHYSTPFIYTPPDRMTDRCKNYTNSQCQGGVNKKIHPKETYSPQQRRGE